MNVQQSALERNLERKLDCFTLHGGFKEGSKPWQLGGVSPRCRQQARSTVRLEGLQTGKSAQALGIEQSAVEANMGRKHNGFISQGDLKALTAGQSEPPLLAASRKHVLTCAGCHTHTRLIFFAGARHRAECRGGQHGAQARQFHLARRPESPDCWTEQAAAAGSKREAQLNLTGVQSHPRAKFTAGAGHRAEANMGRKHDGFNSRGGLKP